MGNKKDDPENEAFQDTMREAEVKGELGGKQGKVVPMEEYKDAKKGVEAAIEEAPDPKGHDFKRFVPNIGKVLIYAPVIPEKTKSGLSVDEKTRARMAEEAKDSQNFRVYGVNPAEKNIEIGDGVMLPQKAPWLVAKIDGFNMRIIDDYIIIIIVKGEYVKGNSNA